MSRKCCVGGCNGTSDTHRLFSFPKNDYYRKLWLLFLVPTNSQLTRLTKDQLLKRRVCHKHFDRYQMDAHGGRLRYSYPCLFSEKEIAHGTPLSSEEYSALSEHNYHKKCNDDNTETSSNFENADDDCFNEHSSYKMPVFVDINSVNDTWSMEEEAAPAVTQRLFSASQHIRPVPKAMIIRPMNQIENNPIEETMADETGAMLDNGWDREELILDNPLVDAAEDNAMPVKYSLSGGLPERSDVPLVESSKDDSMLVAVKDPSTLRKEQEKRRRFEDSDENSSKVRRADLARKKIRSGLYARPANSQLKVLILAKAGVRMPEVSRTPLAGSSENISKPVPVKDPLASKKMIMSKRRRVGGAVENPSKSYAYTMALSRKLRLESYARKVKAQLKLLMLDKSGVRMREVPGSPLVSSSENNSMHIPAQDPPAKKNLKGTRRRVEETDEILSKAHGIDLARKKLRLGSNVRVAKSHLKVLILDKSGVRMDDTQALVMRKKLEECHMQGYLQNRGMVAPAFSEIQLDQGGLRVEAGDDYSLAWLTSFVESLPGLWNGSWGYKVVSLAKKTCKATRYMTGKMFLSDFPYRNAEMLRDFLAYCNSKYRVLTWPIFAHEYSDDIETKQTNHVLTLGIPTQEAIEINRNGKCLFFKLVPVPIEIKNQGHPAIELRPQIPNW